MKSIKKKYQVAKTGGNFDNLSQNRQKTSHKNSGLTYLMSCNHIICEVLFIFQKQIGLGILVQRSELTLLCIELSLFLRKTKY